MILKTSNTKMLRTDKIRRRSADKRSGLNTSTARKYNPPNYAPPPVMMRSASGGVAFGNRKTYRNTRRYKDVPLHVPGAEISLPAFPKLQFGWRLLSFLIVVVFVSLLYVIWDTPYFKINQAEVSGLINLTETDVFRTVDLIGESIFFLDANKLEEGIMRELPELSQVAVEITLPSDVMIHVTERVPSVILQNSGSFEFVDENGTPFPVRNENMLSLDYPVVYLDEQASQTSHEMDWSLVANPTFLSINNSQMTESNSTRPENSSIIDREIVSAIVMMDNQAPDGAEFHFDLKQGLWWKDRRGWDVIFGSAVDLDKKLIVYKSILEFLKNQNQKPSIINVEFAHAPYYKLEQ